MTFFRDKSIGEVVNYWNERPCNVRHSTSPVGSLQYSREVSLRKYLVEPHIPNFAQFSRWQGKSVLEVGCGIGTDTISFAKAGAYVTAVDLSQESIDIARQRVEVEGVADRVHFVVGNAEHLEDILHPGPPSFDLIYSFGVLHHTPTPERAFGQVALFTGPSTAVKLMLYNKLSTKALALTRGRLWRDDLIAKQSEAQTGCPVTYSYTPWEVRSLLSEWFDVERVRVDHIFPYKLAPYLQYRYEKQWWAELPGFRAAERLLGWHLLIDARRFAL
jgi:SAM-dependent methyltransferase